MGAIFSQYLLLTSRSRPPISPISCGVNSLRLSAKMVQKLTSRTYRTSTCCGCNRTSRRRSYRKFGSGCASAGAAPRASSTRGSAKRSMGLC
ncbi:MAG: hypothetical protein ACKODX_11295 [Gemmata sp.]